MQLQSTIDTSKLCTARLYSFIMYYISKTGILNFDIKQKIASHISTNTMPLPHDFL